MLTRDVDTVAIALAQAFLDGAWEERALVRRATRILGRRPRWLLPLARRVLAAYHRPPADRPRELRAFIRRMILDDTGHRGLQQPFEIRRWTPVPTRMITRRWPVPVLDTVGDLGSFLGLEAGPLMWLADARGLERFATDEPLRNYRYTWVPRAAGPPRLLEAPKATLKQAQRDIAREILRWIPVHDAAYGFVAGRSAIEHAARHAGREVVLSFDLADFFAHVSVARVYGTYRTAGYPEPVAHCLAALATNQIPRGVEQALAGQADPAYALLRRRLTTAHLPQGAPTSPALANLAAFRLDRRVAHLADAVGATYTRYADDLVLSGDGRLARRTRMVQDAIATITASEGFRLHPRKTHRRSRADRQEVCGMVVNVRTNIPRSDYDRLKAIVHNAARHGPDVANRDDIPDFRAHLAGRIAWVAAVHPERGAKLQARFDEITWPQT